MNWKNALSGALLLVSTGVAQRASNGQQIAIGGLRFDQLEITGINHDNLPATWKSWGQFRSGGVTMAYAEGWWWKESPRIRAQLGGKVVFDCRSGPFKAGSLVVVIVAKSSKDCLGDAQNTASPPALDAALPCRGARRSDQEDARDRRRRVGVRTRFGI